MSGRLATVTLTIVLGLTLTACSPGPSPSPTPQIYSGFTPLPYPLSTANDYLGNVIDMSNGYVGGATKCLINSGQPNQPSVLTGIYDYTYNTNNSGQILANVYNIVNVDLSAQDIKQIVVHATNPKTSMLADPKQNYSYNCAEYVPSKNNSLYYIVGLLSADTVTYQVATNGTVSGSAGTIGSTPSGPASTPPASAPQQTNGTCPATGASVAQSLPLSSATPGASSIVGSGSVSGSAQGQIQNSTTLCSSYSSAYFAAQLTKALPQVFVDCVVGDYCAVPINPRYTFTVSAVRAGGSTTTISIWDSQAAASAAPSSVTLALTEKRLVPNTNFVVQPELVPGKPTAIRVFFSAQL